MHQIQGLAYILMMTWPVHATVDEAKNKKKVDSNLIPTIQYIWLVQEASTLPTELLTCG